MGDMADDLNEQHMDELGAFADTIHEEQQLSSEYWQYFGEYDHSTGKYLFFCADRQKLCKFARDLISKEGFDCCKVSRQGTPNYVLCVYWLNDLRKHELKRKYGDREDIMYRWWKSNADTMQGRYSKQYRKETVDDG